MSDKGYDLHPHPTILHANKLVELTESGDRSECEKTISQCLWPNHFPKFLQYCVDLWIFYVCNQSSPNELVPAFYTPVEYPVFRGVRRPEWMQNVWPDLYLVEQTHDSFK